MATELQIEFFYASLDFPGRTTLTIPEMALRTGYTCQHFINLIEAGDMVALNGKLRAAKRSSYRVPIEEYRRWVINNLTGPAAARQEFLRKLPRNVLTELVQEATSILNAA